MHRQLLSGIDPSADHRVLAVTWIAHAGSEGRVKDVLIHLAEASRREAGCLQYVVHQLAADPTQFFLYEVYRDGSALIAHSESDHFKRYVLREAPPLLKSRQRLELRVISV